MSKEIIKPNETSGINENVENQIPSQSEIQTQVAVSQKTKRKPLTKSYQDGVYGKIKDAVKANKKVQDRRTNYSHNLGDNQSKIRITPLGGLENIGGNMAVLETAKEAIIIDVGISFPDPDMHGVDILIPDFSYLKKIKNKLKAIVITHAHEDHIGAVPYLIKEYELPIYGTPMPLSLIESKFNEHKLHKQKSLFRYIEKRKIIKIGDFLIEWLHITHSTVDCSALAITTKAGVVIHTGDFKLDNTPVDGFYTDYHRFAYYGDKGVLCCFADSTNSHNNIYTSSESRVRSTFKNLFQNYSEGRLIMSTFSSNLHRITLAIEQAINHKRKICVIGRSLEKNLNIALELDYLKFDKEHFIDASDIKNYQDNEILIITTGSQGEVMSALYRIAIGEHKQIKIKPDDAVILSCKAIPGNEPSIASLINKIERSGAKVLHHGINDIHVSGHGGQEDQKFLLRLIKPKYFLPIHGEYQHRSKHIKTALELGIKEHNTILIDDGETVEINNRYMKKVTKVRVGKIFIDNYKNNTVDFNIVHDRKNLANYGIVMFVLQISKLEYKLTSKPRLVTYGLVNQRQEEKFSNELEKLIEKFIESLKEKDIEDVRYLENNLRSVIKKHIYRTMKCYPIIVANIFVQ